MSSDVGRRCPGEALPEDPPSWFAPNLRDLPEPDGGSGTDKAAGNGSGTESLEATVERLASLPPLEYEQCRKTEAERLGVRVIVLNQEVKKHRKAAGDGAGNGGKQGREIKLPEPEPCAEPVNGAELLESLVTAFRSYLSLPDGAAEAMSLWTVHTHAFEAAYVSPRLFFTSPLPRCGKSRALEVLERLVMRPLPADSVTPSIVFRIIELKRPTLLIDELDTFALGNDELRGMIDSGHSRGGSIIRAVGDDFEPRQFSTWAPMALASIGKLARTVEDRSIIISMRRKCLNEKVEQFRIDRTPTLDRLAPMIARWVRDNLPALKESDPEVPRELHDRAADNWRPLLSIADLAGEHWPETARRVAKELSGADQDEGSYRVELLADIRSVFDEITTDRLPSQTLCDALIAMEDRPWGEWRKGRPLTTHGLARILKPFKIKPKTVRVGVDTIKGYLCADFKDTFASYLGDTPPQTVTPSQVRETKGFGGNQTVTQKSHVTVDNRPKAAETVGCYDVTVEKGDTGEVRQWKETL